MGGTEAEKRVLAVLGEVYRNHRHLNVPEEDGRLLRILTESIGAQHVVEVGTSTGYSGLWILLALMNTGGRLTTYEIDRGRHETARQNFERAGLLKHATLVLGDAHAEVTKLKGPLDLVFLDADKEGYPDYLRKLAPLVRPGGLIVAHNMASPPPEESSTTEFPRPEEPAAPSGQGTLNINSLPLSKVLLDGRPLGSTPKVGVPVAAGNHTVTFVHPELGRKSVTVNVKPGQTATASVRFQK